MKLHPDTLRTLAKPMWLAIVILSVLIAAGGALWLGLQQDQGETSTTFVFGNRVGFDAPVAELEDHVADIVNSVEFGPVFVRIEERILPLTDDDYELAISILEGTQSVVAVEVRTDRSGEADRVARIIAEEMVRFVLEGVDESIAQDFAALDRDLMPLTEDQARLTRLAGGADPVRTQNSLERELASITAVANSDPVGTLEGELLSQISNIRPIADEFSQNQLLVDDLERQMANIIIQRAEIRAATESVSEEWYRSITPVESTSNVPVAFAMAFAAAVPALVAALVLVALNINRRLVDRDRRLEPAPDAGIVAA